MTTNVFDRRKMIMASDSRWSSESGGGEWVAYVDDTNYDKLAFTDKVGFLFAGDMPPIERWKQYVANGMKKGTRPKYPTPDEWIPGNRISVIQVELDSKLYVTSHKKLLFSGIGGMVNALYAGTGAHPAKECWEVNKCSMTAVASASVKDTRSGGSVVYLHCATRENNVLNSANVQSVQAQMKDRGYIMNVKQQQEPVLLKVAANDPSVPAAQIFAQSVLSGATPLTAPFSEMDEPWTAEAMAEFDAMLDKFETE
jgi:hypothetical protein